MASFAERMGRRAVRTLVQSDDLDVETRTELWNVLVILRSVFRQVDIETYNQDETESQTLDAVWAWEFKQPRDERRGYEQVWGRIKKTVLEAEWFDVLDLLEAIVRYLDRYQTHTTADTWSELLKVYNDRFEHYLVGYRFIGTELTPVDSSAEADAIAGALEATDEIAGARHALNRAVELLADRQTPDYPNSIKESISAVEAVVRRITGEGTLGAGLNKVEAAGLVIHPALKGAWSKMYGYASDGHGIRHGSIEAANADQALAKYMLVTCSAFVSYLIEEGRKTSLI